MPTKSHFFKKIFIVNFVAFFMFIYSNTVMSVSDLELPEEVCSQVQANDCSELTEEKTNSEYVDLNGDKVNELIFTYGGGSCGSIYWVFELNKLKWKSLGSWCGCEDNIFKIQETSHNGYLDIWSCGYSGFFNGEEYIGYRQ